MNPINDEISEKNSQNPTILEAKEKIETTECEKSNKIENSKIQTNDETKDMKITEKTEEENREVLKEQLKDDDIPENQKEETVNAKTFNDEDESNKEQSTDFKKILENTETNKKNEENLTNEQSDISKEHKNKQNKNDGEESPSTKNSETPQEEKDDAKEEEEEEHNTKSKEDNTKSEKDEQKSGDNNTKSDEDSKKSKDDKAISEKITEPDLKEQLEEKDTEEKEINETDVSTEKDKQQDDQDQINANNKNNELESESESEVAEEIEEEYEDVEVPEEVEELIVPDETDAEDLTSCNGDDPEKSLNEDENTKDSEAAEDLTSSDGDDSPKSPNEEGTTKEDSEAAEQDENETSVNEHAKEKEGEEEDLTKDTEDEADIDNLEPELVAIEEGVKERASLANETTNNVHDGNTEDDTKNTINDPLNCTSNPEQEENECENDDNILSIDISDKNDDENDVNDDDNDINDDGNAVIKDVDDDDEDEVQFVETRNSPICIESDDEDVDSNPKSDKILNTSITTNPKTNKQTITTSTATITVPKNIIVTRTSARKSTAKIQQVTPPPAAAAKKSSYKAVPQMQNKPKNFSYLEKATYYKRSSASKQQQVVDCIELLDSSDEEASASHYRPTSAQQIRTPQKRTLLAAKGNNKNSNKNFNSPRGQLPTNFPPQIRKQIKKPASIPLPPATPQSNFLNAVQLQPVVSGINPPAFSALLSNKNVIIPNAFYGNPGRGRNDVELERRYAKWLENFLLQFCNPHLVVTHSCFVILQKSLKYKDFARIKAIRSNMNTHAQTAVEQLNNSLMVDIRTILMKNHREVTTHGRRFCELACNSSGRPVTLIAHSISGRVTMKTCNMDTTKASISSNAATASTAVNSVTRKRQLEEEEEEYMPDKQKLKTITQKPPSENGDSGETSEDRKRSLRTKRTKRLDNSFSYNEDELLAEFEIDDEEEVAEKEIQRKINQKRLEAQKQREQQVKSFESAFIQAFARNSDEPAFATSSKNTRNVSNQRIRLRNSTTETTSTVQKYTANNDTEDLLQATWVDNDDAQIISDDDEPKVHRIYKKQEQQQFQQQFLLQQQQQQQQEQQEQQYQQTLKLPTKYNTTPKFSKQHKRHQQQQEEIITGDDDYIENDNFYTNVLTNIDISQFPNNIDRNMHVNGKFKDKCVICNINCQRIVHHYVNEHRGAEVYNSRLTSSQIHLLSQGNCSDSIMSMYKNGQPQFEAYCIFCQKKSRFMLPYWFQHFTMHTGEYAYRCSGCGIRKPTRSLLTQHQSQGCPENGNIVQDYSHDAKSSKVEARVCTLCNYVQLHRGNIVKHLHQQHDIKHILPKHIQTIVLLKTPSSKSSSPSTMPSLNISLRRRPQPVLYNQSSSSSSSSAHNAYIIDDDYTEFAMEQQEESGQSLSPTEDTQNHYYNYIPPYMQAGNSTAAANFTWEDNDPEDLSFMICGMLDVQMNTDGN